MLIDQIKTDMKDAMKAKDDLKVQTLRMAIAACTNELVAKNMKPTDPVDDAMALTVLKRLSKQRKDAAEQIEKGGRQELAEKEIKELAILETYLPQMASREDVERIAKTKKEELGLDASGKGKLMGAIIKEFGGNADSGMVKEVVDSLFA